MKLTLYHILLVIFKCIYCKNEIHEIDRCKDGNDVHDTGNLHEKSSKIIAKSRLFSTLGGLQIEIEETFVNMYLYKGQRPIDFRQYIMLLYIN